MFLTIIHTHRYTHAHYQGDEEEAQHISLNRRTLLKRQRYYSKVLKMTFTILVLVIILGIVYMAAQRDDIRVNILSVNKTIHVNTADIKPKAPTARNVTIKRMSVNNSPRM